MIDLTKKEEQILLAIFQIGSNAYLINIREQIKQFTGKYYSVGTIYAPLNRLHLNGFLESHVEKTDDKSAGKPIKYYTLTEKGLKALAALQQQNQIMWDGFAYPALED